MVERESLKIRSKFYTRCFVVHNRVNWSSWYFELGGYVLRSSECRFSLTKTILKKTQSCVPVAHTCNPSYLGGWDQEDHGSRPVQAKNSGETHSQPTVVQHRGTHLSFQAKWETEIRRITVPGKPEQKSLEIPSKWKKARCGGMFLSFQLRQEI
jgi:hypothetical protein